MKWHVVWKPRAQADLTNIWIESSLPSAVSAAANLIDSQLRNDPLGNGESRSGKMRIYVERPLTVYARVIVDDCRVDVLVVERNDLRRAH